MKSQLSGPKPVGAALSLQEELLAAIHGAFEVAVEIAAREVKKLVGQATGDKYEDMRRENESLRQRLCRAEAMLSSARQEGRGGSSPAKKTPLSAPEHTVHQPVSDHNELNPNPKVGTAHSNTGGKGEAQPASDTCARRHLNTQDKHMSAYDQRSGHVKTKCASDCVSEPDKAQHIDVHEHIPRVCDGKVERILPCQDAANNQSSQLSSTDDEQMFEPAAVKQEMPEVESIKMEDLSSECMSEVPSTILEEWKPKELDLQSRNPNTKLPYTRLTQVHPPNITKGIPLLDHPPLTSELSISQASESAPTSEAPPPIYGVHVRIRRNNYHAISNFYVCKSCNQTFPLPSLWRRHYSQCQQKLQQPRGENNRPRLQIYPPGCSPFRCTECNREFNRMENLKTHLRIHTGERPYTCSVCSKCFRHSGALTRHFRIHTGEKPYVCGQCGKSFRNCGGLRFHQRSHSKALQ